VLGGGEGSDDDDLGTWRAAAAVAQSSPRERERERERAHAGDNGRSEEPRLRVSERVSVRGRGGFFLTHNILNSKLQDVLDTLSSL
jgi:hypothetical protein